jgi:hypothetical protein
MADTKPTATKPKRKVISIDFTESPAVYDLIVNEAEVDDRTPANWLRRFIGHHFIKETLTTPK